MQQPPAMGRRQATRLLTAAALAAGTAAPAAAAVRSGNGAGPEATALHALRRLSLEEKVGQLFATFVHGDRVGSTDPAAIAANQAVHGVPGAAELIERYHPGGIIYFTWTSSLISPTQIARLSADLQDLARGSSSRLPLLIAVDQEYGPVRRIGPPATQFPGAMALGAGRDPELARAAAEVAGTELTAMGINQVFAPVGDVNADPTNPVIGVRSFGEEPALVTDMVIAQLAGFRRAGLAAAVKHFPGHGDTAVDSHTGLPEVTHTRPEWERLDAPPFRAAIRAGTDVIMTGHLRVPHLDPSGTPATLSRPVLTGLLREELGYSGVIATDALDMGAIRQHYADAEVPVLALEAGADLLLMPPNTAVAFDAVLAAVRQGRLTEERVDASVLRLLRLKAARGLLDAAPTPPGRIERIVGAPAHLRTASRVADRATTVLHDAGDVLPLAAGGGALLVTGWNGAPPASGGDDGQTPGQPAPVPAPTPYTPRPVTTLGAECARRGNPVEVLWTDPAPTPAQIDAATAAAGRADTVLVVTNRAWSGPEQRSLVAALVATGRPVIAVAVRDPYDAGALAGTAAFLATYSDADVSMAAAARVLFGEIPAAGRLPVTVPATGPGTSGYPFGHGLTG
ncbi:glycoside hydrolase family 3 protein [Allostreptomyces psammosilenae]|uniref:beta-N-acetylhexosaminidase n=1 Tax=Allostreptomyces psammosilenae TaxID=1892865 RepID=A0A853A364_9ACTN|nr:glycoside hydrolase family 3 protein [Allostreptomyces psammosilenae]NYI04918.1 beta-N-acetylhexosaminidase [Allostreptomyces psammosilenae]